MKIVKATRLYEEFLAQHVDVVRADLALKHRAMARGAFYFLRGTFYRWAQRFVDECADLADAPAVLGVGDLHVANFGTWRDVEGRLVWGVNDFDEVCQLPFTNDLVRLATSARLAIDDRGLRLSPEAAAEAILDGYRQGLELGGRAFVLDEEHRWLNQLAHHQARDPARFWKKLDTVELVDADELPRGVADRLVGAMPERGLSCRFGRRITGVGSLGRPRYVALAVWRDARVARETKALLPSAWRFARRDGADSPIRYAEVLQAAVRSPDPWLSVDEGWVGRRLSPICTRIELGELPDERDEHRLLGAMGFETANIHVGTRGARKAIRHYLDEREPRWLQLAADRMLATVHEDHALWIEHMKQSPPEG